MMFVDFHNGVTLEVYVGQPIIKGGQHKYHAGVVSVQADGHELSKCCAILGRTNTWTVHTFVDESAREIVANW